MADITVSYKGSTIAEVSASGTTTLGTSGKYCEDDISIAYTKPSGVVSAPPNDVNFIDYDGTIVASYSAADFANLSAMPDNPTHTGLTAQGWNWTLADAKAQVDVSGQLDIGQMYVTDDGKTRVYISIPSTLLRNIKVYWGQTIANDVVIDWGDGSATETFAGTGNKNTTHTYSAIGDYVITLKPTSGTLTLGNGSNSSTLIFGSPSAQAYKNCVKRVEVGSNVAFSNNLFYSYNALESITIPKELTALGTTTFYTNNSLKFLTIPTNVDTIGTNFVRFSYSLESISVPKAATTFGTYAIAACNPLKNAIIPQGTTSIPEGLCQYLTTVVKVVIPSSITSIATKAFGGCTGLQEIHFKPTTPPTVENADAFSNLPTTCKIYVPSGYLSAYTSANNYPSSSSYTYIEE